MKDLNQNKRRAYYQSRYKKDYTLLVQIIVVAVLLTVSFFALARAVDIWALNTCVDFNDCEAVVNNLNT